MLCYYKNLTTNMSSNIFNCCVYRAAADTLGLFEMNYTSLPPAGESSRLQSGAELKAETSSRTLSAPGSDALTVFACSYHR